jgi:predicted permease
MHPLRRWTTRARTIEGLWQDVRFAVRTLRNAPGFTAVVLLTFALGVGGNTAVFSVVRGVLFRPLPFRSSERLAAVATPTAISNAEFEYLRGHASTFEEFAIFSPGWGFAMRGGGEPRQLNGARVSTNFFRLLGVRPVLGRDLVDGESEKGQWDVALISHELWTTQFGADPSVIGRVVQMDHSPTRIIGVIPAGFEAFHNDVEVWLPIQIDRASPFHAAPMSYGLGRLARGATPQTATAELRALVPQMRAAFNYRDDYGRGASIVSLHERLVGNLRQPLLVLLGAVAFVLLIAGANVGNLLLLQAASRQRELAVRRALGASRAQLIRQLFVQSCVVTLAGGALGVAVGALGVRGLKAILPPTLPMLGSVSLDATVLLVSAGTTIATGLFFGVAPALTAMRVDPAGALRGSASGAVNRTTSATRRTLVVVEVALAMVLLIGASLMIESLRRLSNVELGFDAGNVVSFRIQPSNGQFTSAAESRLYFETMLQRIAALPEVESVGGAQHLPLGGFNWPGNLEIETAPVAGNASRPHVVWRSVIGDYFATMRIPLLRGRFFGSADSPEAPPVVIINNAMAERFWPGKTPIGERIRIGGARSDWATIVGIVGTVRFRSPSAPPEPEVYLPNAQQQLSFMHLVIRTKTPPLGQMSAIRGAVRSIDTTVPIADVRSLDELYQTSTETPRAVARLLFAFAAVGLILASIGIYGVISYAVAQRTRELGIRTALGAIERRIILMVVTEALRMTAVGVAIGALSALFAARSLKTLVFGVTTTDAVVYTVVAVTLGIVAAVASYVPARRAARVDPLTALRSE